MAEDQLDMYSRENRRQPEAEVDVFTVERYRQFARHMKATSQIVLDVGCSTGRGGVEIALAHPDSTIWGLDAVQERLDWLPAIYSKGIRGLSTDIPLASGSVDVVLAGEFLEHLRPHDVDLTICEFQRVLKVGGRLILTTPNPAYIRLRLSKMTVYGPGHLTQHPPSVLKNRLRMHGFSKVRVRGSGRISRHLGEHVPLLQLYGSYLVRADKI